jgi:WD40 repeat protein
VLKGHAGAVSAVAFSKDGKVLVSASQDGTLRLWPTEGPGEPEVLQPNLKEMTAMAVSADGRYLTAGGASGKIKLWKWGQWTEWIEVAGAGPRVTALALSPDGTLLATVSDGPAEEHSINLYTTIDGKQTRAWPAHKGPIEVLTFSTDGDRLASSGGKDVKLWDIASRRLVFEHGNFGDFRAVALSPDGKQLFAGLAGQAGYVFDLETKKEVRHFLGWSDYFSAAVYRPDGKRLVVGTDLGMVQVWDIPGQLLLSAAGHHHYIRALALAPDGRTILTAGDDYTLRRWDLQRPVQNRIVRQFDRGITDVFLSPDGKKYLTSATFDWFDDQQRVVVWDAATDKQLFHVDPAPNGWSGDHDLTFSTDSEVLAGFGPDSRFRLWDAATGKEVHTFPEIGPSTCRPAFSGDGKLLATATTDTKLVKVWDVAGGEELHSVEHQPVYAVALSYEGRLLAASHWGGEISVWDLAAKDHKKRTLTGHKGTVRTLRFTPDGKTLVSAGEDGVIRLWSPERERALQEAIPLGPEGRPLRIDLDPTGKYLIAGGHAPVIFVLRLPGASSPEN